MKQRRYELSEDGRTKIREFESEQAAILAERYLRELNDAGIGSPKLEGRQARVLRMEFVEGQPLGDGVSSLVRREMAELMAGIHSLDRLDLPLEEGLEAYRRYAGRYLQQFIEHGLLDDKRAGEIVERLMDKAPGRFFAALVHDDLNVHNVLQTENGLVLIDYAGVKPLSLEHDLLNASRTMISRPKALVWGRYGLRGDFVRRYSRFSPRTRDVLASAREHVGFFEAYNRIRKGSNSLQVYGAAEPAVRVPAKTELDAALGILNG